MDTLSPEQVAKELQKCIKSPYYFATTYCVVIAGHMKIYPFTTHLTEKEFNDEVNSYKEVQQQKGRNRARILKTVQKET